MWASPRSSTESCSGRTYARVGESPGKTVHINYFLVDGAAYLVDLPGYGYAKVSKAEKDRWARLMEDYFAAEGLITLGVMIVDARHKPRRRYDKVMADWFMQSGAPFLVVANKLDKLKKERDRAEYAAYRGRAWPAGCMPRAAVFCTKG